LKKEKVGWSDFEVRSWALRDWSPGPMLARPEYTDTRD
jgi:hypothetical protein